jgi:hypothetical protein
MPKTQNLYGCVSHTFESSGEFIGRCRKRLYRFLDTFCAYGGEVASGADAIRIRVRRWAKVSQSISHPLGLLDLVIEPCCSPARLPVAENMHYPWVLAADGRDRHPHFRTPESIWGLSQDHVFPFSSHTNAPRGLSPSGDRGNGSLNGRRL